ncbi:MAG: hypothetical protein SNH35_06675 [Rikenellaceae bacterium]
MIELWIDGVCCDVAADSTIVLSYDIEALMSDLDEMSEGVAVSVTVPSSVVNDGVFAGDGYLHAPKRFNAQEHTAVVKSEGVVLIEGSAHLQEVEWQEGEVGYVVSVRVQRALWAEEASKNVFNEFAVELDMKLAVNRIKEQWESDDPVRFVAVRRDTYEPIQSSVSNESVREIPSLEDYHPFLNVDVMMRSVFEAAGYRVKSEFMDSEYFKSLYMSGSYGSSTNSEQTVNAMDFYVRRYEDCTVEADYRGRVYMTPYYGASCVGMVVDPDTVNTESDCYSNGGCFQTYETVPAFVPLTQTYVGFAVRLKYITPYKIADRETLTAFNSVHLCVGHDYEFEVANRFSDLKGEDLVSYFSYMLCVFDYDQADDVSIYFRMADGTQQYYGKLSSRVTYITTPVAEVSALELMTNVSSTEQQTYDKDWALYNGYVQESGETEVDVTLRITPTLISPTSPKKFDEMYIDCGEAGWEFTLLKETCITPYFYKHPGVNAFISFEDIAQHDKYQASLVKSIAHMYNLRFWTDDTNKMVYVEPYDDMWDRSRVWDWSDKIDWQSPVEISDLAADVYKQRKWGYIDGDGVTARGDDIPTDEEFGFWEAEIESSVAKDTSVESLLSPLYSPSQNDDYMLLQVGDRDELDSVNSFDFTPRIVRHVGSMTYDNAQMPYISFYDPDSDVSLCFEDRGGVTGLNSYYQGQIALEERGRVVSLWMKLSAADVASLFVESDVAAGVRSIFGLDLKGDYVRCILREIVEYDPLKEIVKCRFIVVD